MAERRWKGWLARLRWSIGVSLTSRILAVNIIALGLLAGSLFYLDNYRNRLLAERFQLARAEVEVAAGALALSNRAQTRALLVRTASQQQLRLPRGARLVETQQRRERCSQHHLFGDRHVLALDPHAVDAPGRARGHGLKRNG